MTLPVPSLSGIAASSAPVIAILDEDNLYDPTHLEVLLSGLAHTNADYVYTGVRRALCDGTLAFASDRLPIPNVDHALRYERRGRLLHERGEVERVITFAEHFTRVVEALGAT